MKKTKIKKFSQREIPKLKRKLWSLLAPLIKERDKVLRAGLCITCNAMPETYNAQTGHCIAKSVCGVLLYFHPKNLALQCGRCNGAGLGEQGIWRGVIGNKKWNELQEMRMCSKSLQWSDFPFKEAIELLKNKKLKEYENLLNNL